MSADIVPAGRPPAPPAVPSDADLQPLIARARKGDRAAADELARVLHDDPDRLIRLGRGQLAEVAEEMAIRLYLDKDFLGRKVVALQMDRMRTELAGPDPTPLERLLVDRVVLCWLDLNCLEIILHSPKGMLTVDAELRIEKRIDRAHRRYLSALRTLASVRKLAPPALQVNIATQGGQQVVGDVRR